MFPVDVKFRGTWRPYQQRVLDALDIMLDDRRLHVVAAPGSGKTVLGLEALLRLRKPALIVSPTLAIRDQWIERFREWFLPEKSPPPEWISLDVRNPGLVTSTTYQGLHMAYVGQRQAEEADDDASDVEENQNGEKAASAETLIRTLQKTRIETLVVDEAHHLRSEWWKTLTDIAGELTNLKIVALTATPPCDVTYQEWQRYQEFCGPVDDEISVPELVLDQNLCPHQDYVYFSAPTGSEYKNIASFQSEAADFCREILSDTAFIQALDKHPAILQPELYSEAILEKPEYYSSIVIFLNRAQSAFPHRILKILGTAKNRIPSLTTDWLETLLTNCLCGEDVALPLSEEDRKRLRQRLSRMGAIERRKVVLKNTKPLAKSLIQSMSKLESIEQIVRLESSVLQDNLRLVVLSDFIRSEDLPSSATDCQPLKRLGVLPIFEGLRRAERLDVKLGCLCGSIIVVPNTAQKALQRIAAEHQVPASALKFTPLPVDSRYCELELDGSSDAKAVLLITQLFTEGGITVLVGTKSLLGEGWDAPCINSLILASFVGSFVLSNQMRGRAIRTFKGDGNKTANVWHLVCLQPLLNPLDTLEKPDLGPDWETLQRRFKVFVGVSNVSPVIENGFARLGINIDSRASISAINELTKNLARDRAGLRQKWETALKQGAAGVRMVEELKMPQQTVPRAFLFQNTLRWLVIQGAMGALGIFEYILAQAGQRPTLRQLAVITLVAALFALVVSLPYLLKAAWISLRYGPVEGCVHQIGQAISRSLTYLNLIKTDPGKISVKTSTDPNGWVSCRLEGGSSFEKSLFLEALAEVLDPLENPRYLISRNSMLLRFLRKDYHAVPAVLSENKERAEYFAKMWRKFVGPTDLIYTRTSEGRSILVKARNASLSGEFLTRAERISAWK